MGNHNLLYAFLGGALVGAGAAILFAPEKGEDLRRLQAKSKIESRLAFKLPEIARRDAPPSGPRLESVSVHSRLVYHLIAGS